MSYYKEKVTNEAIDTVLGNSQDLIRVINNKVIQFGGKLSDEFAYKGKDGKYNIVSENEIKSLLELEKKLNNDELRVMEYDYRSYLFDEDIEEDTDIDEYTEEFEDYVDSDLEECEAYYIGSSDNHVDFFMKIEGCIYILTYKFNEDEGEYFCNVVYNMELESLVEYNGSLGDILCSIDDDCTRDRARDELEVFIEDYA